MLRKPNYCCNCGDKVERLEWHIWNSKRFCELCETEFQFDEWWPRGAVFIILIFGITGIGFRYSTPSDQKTFTAGTVANPQIEQKSTVKTENVPEVFEREGANTNAVRTVEEPLQKKQKTAPNSTPNSVPVVGGESDAEASICGALTKKGTPCARRVKGGGRCWQHRGHDSK